MKRTNKVLLVLLMVLVFLAGLAIILYPYYQGVTVDTALQKDALQFYEWLEKLPAKPVVPIPGETIPESEDIPYPELLDAMQAYNQFLWEDEQSGLRDPWSYRQPSFSLKEYGLDSEIFGVISIPRLNLEMPLYLGATNEHLAAGAAHLSQTSLPIGGDNTNCVIAGHRGYGGATYFKYITDLQPGDTVTITNLWESLTYTVYETKIIKPYEVDKIHIQEGKELLTLLTCHPYASGGKYRYLVFCQRTD